MIIVLTLRFANHTKVDSVPLSGTGVKVVFGVSVDDVLDPGVGDETLLDPLGRVVGDLLEFVDDDADFVVFSSTTAAVECSILVWLGTWGDVCPTAACVVPSAKTKKVSEDRLNFKVQSFSQSPYVYYLRIRNRRSVPHVRELASVRARSVPARKLWPSCYRWEHWPAA